MGMNFLTIRKFTGDNVRSRTILPDNIEERYSKWNLGTCVIRQLSCFGEA